MFSKLFIVFLFVNIFNDVLALVELPQVEENNILETDKAIRHTTNKLFSLLNLKLNKDRPHLKQYSLIHNYLISTSLQDYTNLKEIAKLTRVDKTRLNNETHNFMAIVNEILNEDINHDKVTEDEYVVKHIEGFLTNLDNYTGRYEYSENISDDILNEIFRILEKNSTFSNALKKTINYDKSWLESEEDENLIDANEFWVPNARRIFQGHKSTIKDFPFMASIQVFNHFQCAGSIIKSDMIITAASCLQLTWNNRFFRENPKFLTARVGSSFPNVGGENIEVLEIYFHPDYEPKSLKNNLCILRLQRQLKFKRKLMRVKKIEIDRKPNSLPVVMYGRGGIDITVVGWGAKGLTSGMKDQYISFASLDIYPVQECQAVYSTDFVTQKNFCAGFLSRGGGACSRDIGGPGIMNGVLVGVISFGSPACGTPDAPTVFTKLGFYCDWINSILEQKVVRAKKRTTLYKPLDLNPPIFYTSAKPMFKVTPYVIKKKKKSDIEKEQIETLRALQNKGLLKEFVNTVMGSEEARELLQEAEAAKRNEEALQENNKFTYVPVTMTIALGNISDVYLNVFSNSSSETIEELSELEADKPITKNDTELESQIEKGIMELIDKMNDYVNNTKNVVKRMERNNNEHQTNSLLKLLYLTDMESNESSVSEAVLEEIQPEKQTRQIGIQIPLEIPTQPQFSHQSFVDLTYRNNITDNEIFLSKQDLIDLFSEALKEEIQIKTNATATGIIVQKRGTNTIKQNTTMSQKEKLSYYKKKINSIKTIYSGK